MPSLHCLVFFLFLLFICCETITVSSDKHSVAEVGKDVTLTCIFEGDSNPTVIWEKEGVTGTVHMYLNNKDDFSEQHVNYTKRTEVHGSSASKGNASLTLKNVRIWDEGSYKCSVNTNKGFGEAEVNLNVWAKSNDGIHISRKSDEVLSCQSSGWYPAPTVTWHDKSGNNLNKDGKLTLTIDNNGLYNMTHDLKQHRNSKNQYICTIKHKWMEDRIRVVFSDMGAMIRLDDGKDSPEL
ncbi:V-set domain-containing T-cell activation inhibitor 1 [Heptranchias perlo]|uniref:V-set domain-containing T-cell activation inhibitor 1 n=1 Tax=Heptranchias perlo TaxID=212740 RepID=UPI00355A462A